ncbi:SpaA isopeptide-forming pilin-related protein [Eubacterium sp.]|uniref:SpaA isopeptide-forming pilin-related protein n=1 Tax=Eubacterium sp. TaxID=142586 RepID=UPI0026DF3352|nr:SpaA isopeptide-forming pilin-related protein [Eubacterium sp.]MDO5434464.1 SpaA isopeptide-forming pilin-related protein [Eubacterium sp.]
MKKFASILISLIMVLQFSLPQAVMAEAADTARSDPQAAAQEPAASSGTQAAGTAADAAEEAKTPEVQPSAQTPEDKAPEAAAAPVPAAEEPAAAPDPTPTAKAETPRDIKEIFKELGYSDEQSSILTGVQIKYYDKDGQEVTTPTVDDKVRFDIGFAIPEDVREQMKGGDYYSFELPENIIIENNTTINLVDENGVKYGEALVGKDGVVTLTFTDEVTKSSDITGSLNFSGSFDKNKINGPGDTIIKFPNEENIPEQVVTIKPKAQSAIEKNGQFDREMNPEKITWNVDINKSLDTIDGVVVKDTLPPGLSLESVQVYAVAVDLDGNVTSVDPTPVDPSAYTVDENGNVSFKNPIDSAYRIVYETAINESVKPQNGGTVKFTNNATLSADDLKDITTSSTVDAKYGKILEKNRTGYDSANQIFSWEIKYNYNETKIPQNHAVVTDKIGDGMDYVDGSLVLNKIVFNADGSTATAGVLVEGQDYTLEKTADGFKVVFLNDVDYAVQMTYKTQVSGILDENGTYSNEVEIGTGQTSGSKGSAKQQGVIKKMVQADEENKRISWSIDVNKNQYTMHNWSLTDTLGIGLTLDESSVVVKTKAGKTLVRDTDYTLSYDKNTNQFVITLIGSYNPTSDSLKITYQTDYYPSYDLFPDHNIIFNNDAVSNWTDEQGNDHSSKDHAEYKPDQSTQYNGFKSGSYNAVNKRITWSVGVNYNNFDVNPTAEINDPITGNQVFVPGSVRIYRFNIDADGKPVKGEEISAEEYKLVTITEPAQNNNVLTVRFPDQATGKAIVEFQTSLEGQVIKESETYTNIATFTNGKYTHTLTGTVSVNNGGKLAVKSGKQDSDGYVHWHITVNPSQSDLADVVIIDKPSDNQLVDMDSLTIYGTQIDEEGNLTLDTNVVLVEGVDYQADYAINPETGKYELTVSMLNHIDRAYIMTYRTKVLLEEGGENKVSNNVTIKGNNEQVIEDNDDEELAVNVNDSGGTVIGKKGSITLEKDSSSTHKPLAGGVFQLYDKNGVRLGSPVVSDQNGRIQFTGLVYGSYILKEVEAPEGHTVSDELLNGKTITVNAETTAADSVVILENDPTKVTLVKQDGEGNSLAGAVFSLEINQNGAWTKIREDEALVSGQDGSLVIEGLAEGDYRITETKAPEGYILNRVPVLFTLSKNEEGKVLPLVLNPVQNYQGSIELIKQNEAGEPLSGAKFELRKTDEENKLIAEITSDKDGKIHYEGLAPGSYELVEVESLEGYILNTEPIAFNIEASAEGRPQVLNLGAFVNYQGSIALIKENEGGRGLDGVQFELRKLDEQNRLIATLLSDKDGKIIYSGLAPGQYELTEIKAQDSYILNTEPIAFTIDASAAGRPEVLELGQFVNDQGGIELVKQDESGRGLEGAKFRIIKTDEQNKIIDDITAGKDGKVQYEGLAPGHYTLLEVEAPAGYLVNTQGISFEIPEAAEGKVQTLDLGTLTDYTGRLEILKTDENGKPLAGAVFKILDESGSVVRDQLTTDEQGYVHVTGLAPGQYKVVETKAPQGYQIDTTPAVFEIAAKAQGEPQAVQIKAVNKKERVEYHVKTPAGRGASPSGLSPYTGLDGSSAAGVFAVLAVLAGVAAFAVKRKTDR